MLEKVTERIYYLLNDNTNERPALGLVKGDESCLVIDGGNSIKHAEKFLNEIKDMNLPPIDYVVATHHHWDHIFGLSRFDAIKIASNKTYELAKMYWGIKTDNDSLEDARRKNIFDELEIKMVKQNLQNVDILEEIKFDLLFDGELEINLGGITCLVKEIINPHREDGTIVYVPQEKTLFLGDSTYGCIKEGKGYFNRKKLVSMMEEVKSYDVNYYLCSHESICDKEEITWYFDKLNMGLEITQGLNNKQDVLNRFKEVYNDEPSQDDLFFLESIYE